MRGQSIRAVPINKCQVKQGLLCYTKLFGSHMIYTGTLDKVFWECGCIISSPWWRNVLEDFIIKITFRSHLCIKLLIWKHVLRWVFNITERRGNTVQRNIAFHRPLLLGFVTDTCRNRLPEIITLQPKASYFFVKKPLQVNSFLIADIK